MDIASCCICNTFLHLVWRECIFVEDTSMKRKIFLSISFLCWFEVTLVELLDLSIQSFFNKKDRDPPATICLSKFWTSFGWFFERNVWPSIGGRQNIHVPIGFGKKRWLVFWEMVGDVLTKFDETKILKPTSYSHFFWKINYRLKIHSTVHQMGEAL